MERKRDAKGLTMEIIIPLIGLIFGLICAYCWYRFIRRVGNAVLRIEKQLELLIKQGSSPAPAETVELLKAVRNDLHRHWTSSSTDPIKLRSAPREGEFFYSDEAGKVRGPYIEAQMRAFRSQGVLDDETPVSGTTDGEWTSYAELLP